jgi:acyl-coenzyme A thioesterase PaaI-like protein
MAFAAAVRSLTEAVLSLDVPSARLDDLIGQIRRTDEELRAAARVTALPRVGDHATDTTVRPYLDHSVHMGSYNPVFPEYTVADLSPERATGSVCFPIAYEGPPGYVHGGFLAVFFDVVTGHQSSQAGTAGKTKSLEIRYLRPTPLGVTLTFEIDRHVDGREIVSEASLFDQSQLTCTALARNVAGRRDRLPPVGERVSG